MKNNCILYASNEHVQAEIKNIIPFAIPPRTVGTYICVNLTKHV